MLAGGGPGLGQGSRVPAKRPPQPCSPRCDTGNASKSSTGSGGMMNPRSWRCPRGPMVWARTSEASCVLHLDPWWNPAVEPQVGDPSHRYCQAVPVHVFKCTCVKIIENRTVLIPQRKQQLFDESADDVTTDPSSVLTSSELFALYRLEAPSHQGAPPMARAKTPFMEKPPPPLPRTAGNTARQCPLPDGVPVARPTPRLLPLPLLPTPPNLHCFFTQFSHSITLYSLSFSKILLMQGWATLVHLFPSLPEWSPSKRAITVKVLALLADPHRLSTDQLQPSLTIRTAFPVSLPQ